MDDNSSIAPQKSSEGTLLSTQVDRAEEVKLAEEQTPIQETNVESATPLEEATTGRASVAVQSKATRQSKRARWKEYLKSLVGCGAPPEPEPAQTPDAESSQCCQPLQNIEPELEDQPSRTAQIAKNLYLAMKGLGTDEDAINTVLAQVETQEEWEAVQAAFRSGNGSCTFKDGDLKVALESELSPSELVAAKRNLWGDAEDARVWYCSATDDIVARLYDAMKGLGTSEQDIFAALSWVKTEEMWSDVKQAYAAKHPAFYGGDLKSALYSELSSHDLNKGKARLQRNGVHYEDKESRVVRPGDVVELLEFKSDHQPKGVNDAHYQAFHARCEAHDIVLTVWIDTTLFQTELNLPLKVMVDGTMHVAPRLLVIGTSLAEGKSDFEYDAAYPSPGVEPTLFLKKVGDAIENAVDSALDQFSLMMKCKNVEDYFQRGHSADEMDKSLRSKRIVRAVVTWTYSVIGGFVTLSQGDDWPYHAQLRLWLEGGHVLLVDRTDKGIVWSVMTPPEPSMEETKKAFLDGIEEQCAALEDGKGEPLERCIDYGSDGARPIVMVDLRFPGADDEAESVADQASALAAQVPCYKGFNPDPQPGESPDYADGNCRRPFAEPLYVRWPAPTVLHLLCGLYQIADVTYGPPTYFDSYHPRKLNCQAFVFDAVFALLMPPICESPLGSVVSWADRSLDAAPAAPLLRALKAQLVQDADKMLNAGGDCRLGELSQAVAEWVMF